MGFCESSVDLYGSSVESNDPSAPGYGSSGDFYKPPVGFRGSSAALRDSPHALCGPSAAVRQSLYYSPRTIHCFRSISRCPPRRVAASDVLIRRWRSSNLTYQRNPILHLFTCSTAHPLSSFFLPTHNSQLILLILLLFPRFPVHSFTRFPFATFCLFLISVICVKNIKSM